MKTKEEKYYRCNKCGQSMCKGTFSDGTFPMCTAAMPVRTSGICGGSISKEIIKEEYDKQILEWENKRSDKTREE